MTPGAHLGVSVPEVPSLTDSQSQARVSSNPPPIASPFIAAMITFGSAVI